MRVHPTGHLYSASDPGLRGKYLFTSRTVPIAWASAWPCGRLHWIPSARYWQLSILLPPRKDGMRERKERERDQKDDPVVGHPSLRLRRTL